MPAPGNETYDVFVSYAATDEGWAEGVLLDALKEANIRTLSQRAFQLGAFWTDEFERAVKQSRRVVLVVSNAYYGDVNQQFVDKLASYNSLHTNQPKLI